VKVSKEKSTTAEHECKDFRSGISQGSFDISTRNIRIEGDNTGYVAGGDIHLHLPPVSSDEFNQRPFSADHSSSNRFKYDAKNVRLFGRDQELTYLCEFCQADSYFSWFSISAEGGSGKTRLAYELGKLASGWQDWTYYKVDYAHAAGLNRTKQALSKNSENALIVLDYVKWHTDSIGDWLYALWNEWYDHGRKIRVLLVERDVISPHDLRWEHNVLAAQYGRDRELMTLREFCIADSSFLWFDISGKDGETRTVYGLEALLKRWFFWKCYRLDYNDIKEWESEKIKKKNVLEDSIQNKLIVLDAANVPVDAIGNWLFGLWNDWHTREYKIRVLLVRDKAIFQHRLQWENKILATQYFRQPKLYLDSNGLMELHPLRNTDLIKMIEDFAASAKKSVDAPLVVKTLKKVDSQLLRPLYALFLTDAQITGENLKEWDREDALRYIYLKEKKRIDNTASGLPDRIVNIILRTMLIATLSGGMMWDKFKELVPRDAELLQRYADNFYTTEEEVIASCLSIPYDEAEPLRIPPLEPDLLGEFLCVQELLLMNDKHRKDTVGLAMLNDMRRAAVVFDRIAYDYKLLLNDVKMEDLFTMIMVPESVKEVVNGAFAGCQNITSVSLPSVNILSERTFSGCTNLTNIHLPCATSIGDAAFSDCVNLEKVFFPNVKIVGDEAFSRCSSLHTISLPLAERIGRASFSDCNGLESVFFSDVEIVGDYSFSTCSHLHTVALPIAKTIGRDAFSRCSFLQNISFPLVETIRDRAFWCCKGLTEIIFPAVKVVCKNAFWLCESLSTITLPLVERIEMNAFGHCKKLTEIDMKNVQAIDYSAFLYCEKLKSATLPVVKAIDDEAFLYCWSLTRLELPESIEVIDKDAFSCCNKLSDVVVHGNVSDVIRNALTLVAFQEIS